MKSKKLYRSRRTRVILSWDCSVEQTRAKTRSEESEYRESTWTRPSRYYFSTRLFSIYDDEKKEKEKKKRKKKKKIKGKKLTSIGMKRCVNEITQLRDDIDQHRKVCKYSWLKFKSNYSSLVHHDRVRSRSDCRRTDPPHNTTRTPWPPLSFFFFFFYPRSSHREAL